MGRTCVCLLYTYAMDGYMCMLRYMDRDSPVTQGYILYAETYDFRHTQLAKQRVALSLSSTKEKLMNLLQVHSWQVKGVKAS